jgi:hypothetical protein
MDDAAFLAWLAEGGIENASRRGGSVWLHFAAAPDRSRTWPAPDGDACEAWLGAVVRAAAAEGAWWLWRRGGGAWGDARAEIAEAAAASGVSRDFAGAVEFSAGEVEAAMRIIRAFAVWPWGAPDDLYLVPHDRSCVVMICHDEEIHVHAAHPPRLDAFQRVLSGADGESRD